ncbi:hypothetical protein DFH27DRAFT_545872 [Peziza echinospora]|nr:hypothetical protein DFH27DRAFT_545872 [Peziza echinospora]
MPCLIYLVILQLISSIRTSTLTLSRRKYVIQIKSRTHSLTHALHRLIFHHTSYLGMSRLIYDIDHDPGPSRPISVSHMYMKTLENAKLHERNACKLTYFINPSPPPTNTNTTTTNYLPHLPPSPTKQTPILTYLPIPTNLTHLPHSNLHQKHLHIDRKNSDAPLKHPEPQENQTRAQTHPHLHLHQIHKRKPKPSNNHKHRR